ncbi:MAG: glycosyltransferase [Myxococcota bacterium]
MATRVIIPCYDEARRLAPGAFLRALDRDRSLRFRFVNDGSRDHTLEVLRDIKTRGGGRVAITDLAQNSGKAEAVRQGVLAELLLCEGDDEYVGFWDADLATPLEEIGRFADILDQRSEVALVLGSRIRLLGRHVDRKFYRHAYGRVFATMVSLVLRLPVNDTQCGAKLFRVSDATRELWDEPFLSRWIFDVEILARLVVHWKAAGLDASDRIVEQPLERWTDIAGSKVGVKDAARAFWEIMRIEQRYGDALKGA